VLDEGEKMGTQGYRRVKKRWNGRRAETLEQGKGTLRNN